VEGGSGGGELSTGVFTVPTMGKIGYVDLWVGRVESAVLGWIDAGFGEVRFAGEWGCARFAQRQV